MRFAVAASVFFAGAVMAGSQDDSEYTTVTDVETITSCAPTVTDCPARQTTATTVEAWSSPSADPSSLSSSSTSCDWTTSSVTTWPTPTTTAGPIWSGNSTDPVAPSSIGWWADCDCEDVPDCSTSWSSSPTGSSGNGSVSLSSPTSIVTGAASVAAPGVLAVVAGLIAFLA